MYYWSDAHRVFFYILPGPLCFWGFWWTVRLLAHLGRSGPDLVYISPIDTYTTRSMLNTEQQAFYNKVVTRDFSKLLLTGEAGCGKTYVLTQALAELFRQGANVLLCAPTHLARINLLEKMPEDVRPYIPTSTVASLLSRHGFNIGDGNIGFTSPKGDRVNGWEVIAIDEVSMLSKRDYDVLKNSTAKIVFTGDFAQLPTIMQKGSGMLEDDELETIHLEQQMRQQGVIHEVAERNRTEVYFPEKSMADSESAVHVHQTTDTLIERMVADIVSDSRGTSAHGEYRFITFKNTTVYETGQLVRDKVYQTLGVDTDCPFIAGEYLLSYANTPAAYNGEIVRVLDVARDGSHSPSSHRPWSSYRINIQGSRGTCWMACVPPSEYTLIEEKLEDLTKLVREAQKRKALDAVNAYMTEIEHIRNYWIKLLYPFAITCHKSQGSTIENVYVDTNSFAKASNKRALLYVGLSRASKTLHTVIVEKPRWQVVREINDRYRNAKHAYEIAFDEPHWKLRLRCGLPARTPEQKLILAEYMEAIIADAAQDDMISQDDAPELGTLEPIEF